MHLDRLLFPLSACVWASQHGFNAEGVLDRFCSHGTAGYYVAVNSLQAISRNQPDCSDSGCPSRFETQVCDWEAPDEARSERNWYLGDGIENAPTVGESMISLRESVRIPSADAALAGVLFSPVQSGPAPALIVCHGAGEFKENYFELCEALARRGVAALALDMRGHGESTGERYQVEMHSWVRDIQSAISFLEGQPAIDRHRIGAFGLSSGATAILETALLDRRLKVLVVVAATVRNTLPLALSCLIRGIALLGKVNRLITKRDLRLSLTLLGSAYEFAADPEIDRKLKRDPRLQDAFRSWPFPGAVEAFFADTLGRVSGIRVPTLVLWGEKDQLDSPETGRLLFEALCCKKRLYVLPETGHAVHLDRHRDRVFALTADWALHNLA